MATDAPDWQRSLWIFLTSQTLSLFGSSIVQYAIIWHITLSTSSGSMLMLSTLCGFLPQIGISLFAGVWVDRWNRTAIIMLADGAIALSTLALIVLFLTGLGSIWLLFVVLVIRSVGTGIQTPAVNAVIPQLVPRDQLLRVNSFTSSLTALTQFLAPAVSGVMLTLTSLEATFMLDVVTAALGIGMLATLRIPRHISTLSSNTCMQDIMQGFAHLRSQGAMWRLFLYQFVVLVLISPAAFLTPLLISRRFGPEVWRLTVGEMTYSAGAVLGGLLLARWGGSRHVRTLLRAAGGYGMLMICMGSTPFFIVYTLFNLLIGVTAPCYTASLNALIQERVPAAFLGRIFSLVQLSGACAFPAGMLVFGPLADTVSVQHLLIACGSAVLLCTLFTLMRWHVWEKQTAPQAVPQAVPQAPDHHA